jgi:hypothetical protein
LKGKRGSCEAKVSSKCGEIYSIFADTLQCDMWNRRLALFPKVSQHLKDCSASQ